MDMVSINNARVKMMIYNEMEDKCYASNGVITLLYGGGKMKSYSRTVSGSRVFSHFQDPRLHAPAGDESPSFLIAMFPANLYIAINGLATVPEDELIPRTLMQILFLSVSLTVWMFYHRHRSVRKHGNEFGLSR